MSAFDWWPKPEPAANRRLRWRWLACLRATLGGYFWLPCPLCGQMFAGYESSSLTLPDPDQPGHGSMVCPAHDEVWPEGFRAP